MVENRLKDTQMRPGTTKGLNTREGSTDITILKLHETQHEYYEIM